jgi:hypothetical protein
MKHLTKANAAKAFGIAVVLATAFGLYSPSPAPAPKCEPCRCGTTVSGDAGVQ